MYKDDISNMDPQNDLHIVYHCNFKFYIQQTDYDNIHNY